MPNPDDMSMQPENLSDPARDGEQAIQEERFSEVPKEQLELVKKAIEYQVLLSNFNGTLSSNDCEYIEKEIRAREFIKEKKRQEAYELKVFQNKGDKYGIYTNYFHPEQHKDIISSFKILAKGLKKNIVLYDWTGDVLSKQLTPFMGDINFFFIGCPNHAKDVYNKDVYNNCGDFDKSFFVPTSEEVIEVLFASRQFTHWNPFKDLFDTKLYAIEDCTPNWMAHVNTLAMRIRLDLKTMPIKQRRRFIDWLTEKVLAVHPTLPSAEELRALKVADKFIQFNQTSQQKILQNLKNNVKAKSEEMAQHYRALNRLEREVFDVTNQLHSTEDKLKKLNKTINSDTIKKQVLELFKKGLYTAITLNGDKIIAYTDKIYLTNYGKKFYVGKFGMEISLKGNVVMWNTEDGMTRDSHCHPHVNSSGIPCFGNIKEVIPRMIYNGDFMSTLRILHKYLSSYNEEGPYRKLELYWGNSDKDWCRNCDRPSARCKKEGHKNQQTGIICEGCQETIDCCPCERCPMDRSILIDENREVCHGCDNWFDPDYDTPEEEAEAIENGVFNPACNY